MNTPLTQADRDQLERRLRARHDALTAHIQAQLAGRTRAEHAREILLQDGDDAPQRSADREIDLAMTDLETVELAALDAALQRLTDGRYGLCAECGNDIPLARLQAEPQAALCIGCQGAREQGRPHPASL
ncbi:TraR/DksA family transcriptional regulator [Methyloversatilis discipulorum]|uniref:TraR/DksA family transcriptional regulator n=1 Tax=Methyloversatilis discipulorum TaxID=1119528 RepID=UPI001A445F98|nr:TraR/DksA family transcriptional regulator [Methyloversatilis discipulorum]MBL8469761.1 TraR/DksA C4-type zinc finger protein [Methyloversatilis discipulorum]